MEEDFQIGEDIRLVLYVLAIVKEKIRKPHRAAGDRNRPDPESAQQAEIAIQRRFLHHGEQDGQPFGRCPLPLSRE